LTQGAHSTIEADSHTANHGQNSLKRQVLKLVNNRFAEVVFRTRGLYMFIALVVSMVIKLQLGGTTTLSFLIIGMAIMVTVQAFRMYVASFLWGRQAVSKVEADFLCTSGPYAHVRNPLYLGNYLIGLSLCIAINE